jgi:hypothetical protein
MSDKFDMNYQELTPGLIELYRKEKI